MAKMAIRADRTRAVPPGPRELWNGDQGDGGILHMWPEIRRDPGFKENVERIKGNVEKWEEVMGMEHGGHSMAEMTRQARRDTKDLPTEQAEKSIRGMMRSTGMTAIEAGEHRADMGKQVNNKLKSAGYEQAEYDDLGETGQAIGRPLYTDREEFPWAKPPPWTEVEKKGGIRKTMEEETYYLSKMVANEVMLVWGTRTVTPEEADAKRAELREMEEMRAWDWAIKAQQVHMAMRGMAALCAGGAGARETKKYDPYSKWLMGRQPETPDFHNFNGNIYKERPEAGERARMSREEEDEWSEESSQGPQGEDEDRLPEEYWWELERDASSEEGNFGEC